jgi:methyl coenzyme M reductase beta subunit
MVEKLVDKKVVESAHQMVDTMVEKRADYWVEWTAYSTLGAMVAVMVESLAALRAERKVDQMVEMKDV